MYLSSIVSIGCCPTVRFGVLRVCWYLDLEHHTRSAPPVLVAKVSRAGRTASSTLPPPNHRNGLLPVPGPVSCCFGLQEPLNSKRMTKQQLIEKVAAKTELKKSEVEVAVDSVLAMIAEALQANERVDLRGFGSFVVKDRKERQGRNPRTGETITIAAKRDASFKPGKELTEKLAHGETTPTPVEAV